ncbi:MAG: glycosyltransferase family 39 protein [Planctomycetes bacterium]|nr:glycosyltransferase family 39 protein [Planctomycetota bacterium]
MPRAAETALARSERLTDAAAAGATAFTGWQWMALLAAAAAAAALRLHGLGDWSVWVDEAHTWRDATMPLAGESGFLRSDRALYPLTFLAVRGLLALGWVGADEYSLRLPFALVGILTIPVLALGGRRLVGARAAVLAAWFLALNPWHVYWSQNARGYVLTCFFAVVASNRAMAYAATRRGFDLAAALAAIALGSCSHPTALLLGAAVLGFVLLRRVGRLHRRALGWLLVGAVAATVGVPLALAAWSPFQGFLRAKDDPSLLHFLQTTAFFFRPLLLLLAAVGLVFAARRLGRDRALLLGCLAVVPFVLLLAIGGQLAKVTARYAICTLPVLTWLAALACTQVGELATAGAPRRWLRRWWFVLPLPLLLAADFGPQLAAYYTSQHGQRGRWREALEFVQQRSGGAGLRVLTVNEPTVTFYLRPDHWAAVGGDPRPAVVVDALLDWKLDGRDAQGVRRHEPGAANHLRWHVAEARQQGARCAVVVTWPEFEEVDRGLAPPVDEPGALGRALAAGFELALHLPCWVGPKDEGIYVFLPRAE